MEIDMVDTEKPNESHEKAPSTKENGVYLRPVSPEESGEGLPYAPINWPNPGDNWKWRVGRRVAMNGHYLDRYLYPPSRLRRRDSGMRKKGFASKLSVERFIQGAFPGADIKAFFASFSWKIPAKYQSSHNGNIEGHASYLVPSEETSEDFEPDSQSDGVSCKAGNKMCNSLMIQADDLNLAIMPCDICCSEPRFCRDCCCILCCKTINIDYGGYSYIKCEATVGEGYICGHVAHVNCALRSYMAGTVGGNIGLDAEYYCRRCDARTDLVSHVIRLLQICESIDSRDDIEKILNVGVCILHGSKKTSAKRLLNRIELSIIKLKCGTSLEDIWNVEDNDAANFTGVSDDTSAAMEVPNDQDPQDGGPNLLPDLSMSSDYRNEYQKVEYEIDQVLQALRKSQESEYKIAEDRLHAHKNYLYNLFQQLEKERTELARRLPKTNTDTLLNTVLDRVDQVKREIVRLKEMEKIANGFGRTSKGTLKEHFGLNIED